LNPTGSNFIAGLLMLCAAILTTVSEFAARVEIGATGAVFIALFVALEWSRLPPAGKIFAVIAIALFGVAFLADDPWQLFLTGFERAAFMCAFLIALGFLRAAAEGSSIVGRCGRHLLSQRPGKRYLAFWTGGTLFGGIISVGVLGLFGTMITTANTLDSAGGDARIQQIRTKRSVLALLRGFTCSLMWTPMSISLAVVLKSLPNMMWQTVLIAGAGMALMQFAVGWLIDRLTHRPARIPPPKISSGDGWSVHLFPAGLIVAIFLIAWSLEHWTSGTLIAGVMTGAPLVSLFWLLAQGRKRSATTSMAHISSRVRRYVGELVPSFRMELTILSTAGFAGAVVGYFLDPATVARALDWLGAPAFIVPGLIILAIVVGGLLGLNAIITVMIISGALPNPEAFGVHSVIIGVTYLTSWGLTVGSSPVAMSTLIIGNLTGRSGGAVGLTWNGLYTLSAGLLAAVLCGAAVVLFPV
jgi:hypothetical protein